MDVTDVQADQRRSRTYGRAPRHFEGFFNVSVQASTRATLFTAIP